MQNVKRIFLQIEASRVYGRSMLRGIAEYSKKFGPWAFLHEEPFYHKNLNTVKQILAWKPDGIITRFPQKKDIERLRDNGIPIIVARHLEKDIPSVPNVKGDNDGMGKIAGEYLLGLGFHDFGYCGLEHMFWSENRCKAFEKVINKAGYFLNIYRPVKKGKAQNNDQQSLVEWLKSLPNPIAIMACNDDRGKQLIEAAKIAGIRIPDGIAVIGVDDDEVVCDLCYPSLSSVKLNVARAGYETAKLLDDMMAKENLPLNEIIVRPVGIARRQSTDVYCVEDREVAKSLVYIQQNARYMIQVSDVAEYVCLSKRALQLRFKKALGYSLYERIKKEKVDKMAELLTESTMSVLEIALYLGFSSINHISRFFKQEKGCSPLEYRRRYSVK